MLDIKTVYDGSYKTCPRCKGHKHILGQQVKRDTGTNSVLPDYKKIQKGECFLCDATGTAFFTNDNRVMKSVEAKNGNDCVIEFDPNSGVKIRLVPSYEYSNKVKEAPSVGAKNTINTTLKKDDLFPSTHALMWGCWYKEADVIFECYENAKAINVNRFPAMDNGSCINFLLYYNGSFECIKPFYIAPNEDENSHNGIVLVDNNKHIAISGTYIEEEQQLTIGILVRTNGVESFCCYDFTNIEPRKIDKELLYKCFKKGTKLTFEDFRYFSSYFLNDIYRILDV